MPVRYAYAAVTAAVVVLAGCASATSGTGSVRTTATNPQGPASSGSPSPPPSSTASVPAGSGFPSATSSPSACVSTGGQRADYCDDFSDASSGWPVENASHYFANYADYLGGTYRMGERTANGKTQLAPVDITTISKNYGVQVDADAVLGKDAPASSYVGLVCWDHPTSDDTEAGFLFFVSADAVNLTLLPDTGSTPRALEAKQAGNYVRPYPARNHLTATCLQRQTGGGTEADLSLAVNGTTVLQVRYAKSVKNYPWSPGAKLGLLVGGKGSDVFYDNFAVTGR